MLLFPSGFYIVDFIQMHCFRFSLDTINSIYSLGAARGTLRLHSRELFIFLLFTCLFNSGETFFKRWNDIPHIIMWTKIFCAQIWTVVWLCSLLRYKKKKQKPWNLVFFPNQPRTCSLHIIVKFELKFYLFWNMSLFYRINVFIGFVQKNEVFKLFISICIIML